MLGEATNSINLNKTLYSNIKNYDAIHMTPCFNNKPSENHNFFMRKVRDVFSKDELVQLIQFFEKSNPVDIQERRIKDHVSREFLFRRNVSFFPVSFDEKGAPSVNFSSNSTPSCILNPWLKFPETIDKCVLVGLERFGREMGWKNVAKEIACNVVRSKLPAQEEITLLNWHSDFQVDHSFVITLDNPQGEEKGWSGGQFCYSAEAMLDYSMPENYENNISASRDSNYPTWTMSIDQNEGVLFSNKGTVHFISPMTAYSSDKSPVNRHILTFFEENKVSDEISKYISDPQSASELSKSLEKILAASSLPFKIQEQAFEYLVALEKLAETINRYKSKNDPQIFYDAIQEVKLEIRNIAQSLIKLISPCNSSSSKQINEKILEWVYNS